MTNAEGNEQELMKQLAQALNELRDSLVMLSLDLVDIQVEEKMKSVPRKSTERPRPVD